ncbi:hypothetical protein [Aetokthonos hydrillicola]|nr:hypothetical protein [Aetokthonos hydrillicola]
MITLGLLFRAIALTYVFHQTEIKVGSKMLPLPSFLQNSGDPYAIAHSKEC